MQVFLEVMTKVQLIFQVLSRKNNTQIHFKDGDSLCFDRREDLLSLHSKKRDQSPLMIFILFLFIKYIQMYYNCMTLSCWSKWTTSASYCIDCAAVLLLNIKAV